MSEPLAVQRVPDDAGLTARYPEGIPAGTVRRREPGDASCADCAASATGFCRAHPEFYITGRQESGGADTGDLEARLAAVEARLAMLTAAVAQLIAGRGEDHDEDEEAGDAGPGEPGR